MKQQAIVIDDEEHLRTACCQALELAGIEVESFESAHGALDLVSRNWSGVIVSDIKMPGIDGLELLDRALALDPDLPVILITGHGDVSMAVEAMRNGAYDFIEKPFASELLVDAVRRALEKRHLALENQSLRTALGEGSALEQRLIGRSPEMVRLREHIVTFAETDADVLIFGETGVGKELVARSLHDYSPRRQGRFVAINCGALPETMIESELFGHEAGAFTGAVKKRVGRIEHASGGTLFLDEIESMPMGLQVKLLRVLQDRAVVPLGANDEVAVDVRIIAATKEDLRGLADAGQFREDLFYRLEVLTLPVPGLRDRRDDIPVLFQWFVKQACERYNRPVVEISPEKISSLLAHDWPGNVRELQNAALRYSLGADAALQSDREDAPRSLSDQIDATEKHLIEAALKANGNSLKQTYEQLEISRKTLYDKMQKHGINAG